jgi:hypothetical protein
VESGAVHKEGAIWLRRTVIGKECAFTRFEILTTLPKF